VIETLGTTYREEAQQKFGKKWRRLEERSDGLCRVQPQIDFAGDEESQAAEMTRRKLDESQCR
jgi:sRNA-binding protein